MNIIDFLILVLNMTIIQMLYLISGGREILDNRNSELLALFPFLDYKVIDVPEIFKLIIVLDP